MILKTLYRKQREWKQSRNRYSKNTAKTYIAQQMWYAVFNQSLFAAGRHDSFIRFITNFR